MEKIYRNLNSQSEHVRCLGGYLKSLEQIELNLAAFQPWTEEVQLANERITFRDLDIIQHFLADNGPGASDAREPIEN